ncbi:MAG TPA: hypothetical protein VM900_04750 [Sphingomonas sp.]|nr:hypothetical protein [Sphingomonas sp.]
MKGRRGDNAHLSMHLSFSCPVPPDAGWCSPPTPAAFVRPAEFTPAHRPKD